MPETDWDQLELDYDQGDDSLYYEEDDYEDGFDWGNLFYWNGFSHEHD